MIERASPADLRKALDLANEMVRAGISFVPVPVLDESDRAQMERLLKNQLDRFEKEATD